MSETMSPARPDSARPDSARPDAALPNSAELGEIVEQVWSSYLDDDIVADPDAADAGDYAGRLVAWVSISGGWTGHLIVVAGQECARQIAADLFQRESGEVSTAEVADALGEIANMVGGSVKSMVGAPATLSLPQVVLDAATLVSPDARKLVSVRRRWKQGALEFSLWERDPQPRQQVSR